MSFWQLIKELIFIGLKTANQHMSFWQLINCVYEHKFELDKMLFVKWIKEKIDFFRHNEKAFIRVILGADRV